jgi:glycosyltransferase involved in cell wall biosynthesis
VNDSSPIKILITDPHLRGGGQVRYVMTLVRTLQEAGGFRFTIGCKRGSFLAEQGREVGADVLDDFTFRGGLRPRAWAHDIGLVRRFIAREQPAVIHVNGSQDHWVCAIANAYASHRVPLLRTRHNTFPVKNSAANRLLNRKLTDFQIAVCESVRRDLAANPAFVPERLRAIHNGVSPGAYRPNSAVRETMRRTFGFDDNHIVLGMVGRLVADKGHAYLFRAVAQLKQQHPNLRILVVGEGPLEHQLRALAMELGIAGQIVFAGYRNDMAQCVQAVDIGVQPSIACDTSSFSTKEQMAAGKPVIVSDHGGLPEIIRDGETGCVVPAGTVEPLAERIAQLTDPRLRAGLGRMAMCDVTDRFSDSIFALQTAEVYMGLCRLSGNVP